MSDEAVKLEDEAPAEGAEGAEGESEAQVTPDVAVAIDSLDKRMDSIHSDLISKITADDKLQTAFDKLYEEMTQYKENFLFQAQKPLLVDLILLHDQMQTAMDNVEDETAKGQMDFVCEQLLEVLYRRDVEPMEFDPEAKFDREQMKAIKRVSTDDESQDKKIDRLVRTGFAWNERVLRPHEVVVKRYQAE